MKQLTLTPKDMQRYQRQMRLDQIDQVAQQRLKLSRILCVGAGGLGCPALQYLVGAGVGHIGIVDHDDVDISNLHRQILFTESDVGTSKAALAAQRLQAMNSDLSLEIFTEKLTPDLCDQLCPQYDVIIDATDNFTAKFLINDAAVKYQKPWVYGSILGFSGQLAVFGVGPDQPCYRCLFPEPPTQHVMTCAEAGIIGAVAGTIGAMQALEAIKVVIDSPKLPPIYGHLLQFDLQNFEKRLTTITKDPKCKLCSCEQLDQLVLATKEKQSMSDMNDEITVTEVQAILDSGKDAHLIDVREIDEWEAGHIEGADHCPLSMLIEGQRPEDLSKNQDIILYCKGGVRSLQALQILRAQGYSNLKSMAGGIDLWNLLAA